MLRDEFLRRFRRASDCGLLLRKRFRPCLQLCDADTFQAHAKSPRRNPSHFACLPCLLRCVSLQDLSCFYYSMLLNLSTLIPHTKRQKEKAQSRLLFYAFICNYVLCRKGVHKPTVCFYIGCKICILCSVISLCAEFDGYANACASLTSAWTESSIPFVPLMSRVSSAVQANISLRNVLTFSASAFRHMSCLQL